MTESESIIEGLSTSGEQENRVENGDLQWDYRWKTPIPLDRCIQVHTGGTTCNPLRGHDKARWGDENIK